MKKLDPPDRAHLNAARHWLAAGNHAKANEECSRIAPENRTHPDVLQFGWTVFSKAGRWDVCLEIAEALTKAAPWRLAGWLEAAISLYRLGRTEEALEALCSLARNFEPNATIAYYLACCCCKLGRYDEAKEWLKAALESVGSDKRTRRLIEHALDEPDLQPLQESWRG
jgi:pentatricopeptide repeat protein